MSIWGALLDRSIVFNFDRTGFRRHQREFDPGDLEVDLSGRVCLVTGANSGIGFQTTRELARRGAKVVLLCRSETRGREAIASLRQELPDAELLLERLDVSSLADVRAFAARWSEPVHVLVNNAGVLPAERELTEEGLELTWATNVAGPHLLTKLLLPKLKAAAAQSCARVINVSSGGMYSQRIDLDDLTWKRRAFDGVKAYANTKRAEVILTELWAEKEPNLFFASMHPGWADTPAVRTSLPTFYKLTKLILRSPAEGADTGVWLAAAAAPLQRSGRFWFDRKAAATHIRSATRETAAVRIALWELVEAQTQLSESSSTTSTCDSST